MTTIVKNIEATLNAAQRKTLDRVMDWALMGPRPFYSDRYEVKEKEIDFMDGAAHVSLTFGMKNDEGTLAECICRDTYMFFIGNRGGMFYYGKGYSPKYVKPSDAFCTKLSF